MDHCGDDLWCCQTTDQSCCLGADIIHITWELGIPISTILTPLELSTQIPVTTVHKYSTVTKQGEPSIETIMMTMTATPLESVSNTISTKNDALPSSLDSPLTSTPHTTRSQGANLDQRTSLTAKISQTQTNETILIHSASAPSDFLPSPGSSAPSTIRSARNNPNTPTSAPTSAARHITPKTGVGLGVGLCVIVVATVTGIVAWGVRKHRRKALRIRKLKISRPLTVKTIPMFEVANTDWELPVDSEMPAEMSANRRTGRTWI